MSPYTAQRTLPRLGESKRCASFYDLQARSFRAEKLTVAVQPQSLNAVNTTSQHADAYVIES